MPTKQSPAAPDVDQAVHEHVFATEEATPQEILDFLRGVHVEQGVDIQQFQTDFLTNLALESTFAGIFEDHKPTMSKDYVGKPFTATNVRWLKSRFGTEDPTALSFWALIDAVDIGKNKVMIGTSSFNAMAKLWRGAQANVLSDGRLKFEESDHDTERGFRFLKLVPAD